MRLAEVAEIAAIPGAAGAPALSTETAEIQVTGVTHDSRRVVPGDLFAALPGERYDGKSFARAAVERGAAAVLGEGEAPADLDAPWIATANARAALGPVAAAVYGHPDRELTLAGVTGTNGKTTVATLTGAVFEAAGRPAGFLGTLGYRFGAHRYLTEGYAHTTPEASDFFRTLRQMRTDGAAAAAMEVSSHALSQGRVEGALFDAAAFTNLTRDHLDFHGDMEEYFAAKRRLFDLLKPAGRAAVNVDNPYGRRLAAELPGAVTFGAAGEVRALAPDLTTAGIRVTFATPRGEYEVRSPLIGRYNLENLTTTAAIGEALGLPHDAVARGLAEQPPVSGRMEPVDRGQPFAVFVDYAHTDDALERALEAVRALSGGRVTVVFGCGGDRDRGKRPVMGKAAGKLADRVIVTSDNPRTEDPEAILRDIEAGVLESGNVDYRLIADRREAIREAVATAEPGWAVLVAGKGHESEQIVGERRLPFSDRDEIARALEERYG